MIDFILIVYLFVEMVKLFVRKKGFMVIIFLMVKGIFICGTFVYLSKVLWVDCLVLYF